MPGHTDPHRIEKDTLDSIDAKHSNWETLYEKGCLGLNMNFAYGKSVSIELDGPEISKVEEVTFLFFYPYSNILITFLHNFKVISMTIW